MSNETANEGPKAEDFLLTLIETLQSNTAALTSLDGDIRELRLTVGSSLTDTEFKEKMQALENKLVDDLSVLRDAIDEVHEDLSTRNIIEEVKITDKKEWREQVTTLLSSKPALLLYSFSAYVVLGYVFPLLGMDISVLWNFMKALGLGI